MTSSLWSLLLIGTGLGWATTWAVRVLVRRVGILDTPNQRSSHARPMPTLGGLGIIGGTWLATGCGYFLLDLPLPPYWGAFSIGSLILIIFAADEIRPMSQYLKLFLQVIIAAVFIGWGVTLNQVEFPGLGVISLGDFSHPLTLLWLVAIQNLYNFMDGIDGLAGLEGFLVAGLIGGMALMFVPPIVPLCLALVGATLGFLFWNFPPGKIFMGDVGGHFLGLILGVIAVIVNDYGIPFWICLLFLGAFLIDSMYTIVRRLFRGENIAQAHRFHIYQRLNTMGWSHHQINILFGSITLLFGGIGFLNQLGHVRPSYQCLGGLLVLIALGTIRIENQWCKFHQTGIN